MPSIKPEETILIKSNKFPVGIDNLGQCFDIVALDPLYPKPIKFISKNEVAQNENTTERYITFPRAFKEFVESDTHLVLGEGLKIPNTVDFWSGAVGTDISDTKTFNTVEEFQDDFSIRFGFKSNVKAKYKGVGGGRKFSMSASYEDVRKKTHEQNSVMLYSEEFTEEYMAVLSRQQGVSDTEDNAAYKIELSGDFKAALGKINNAADADDFVRNKYGTHYAERIVMGKLIYTISGMQRDHYSKMHRWGLDVKAAFSISGEIGDPKKTGIKVEQGADMGISKKSMKSFNKTIQEQGRYSKSIGSDDNPAPIGMTLRPIYCLLNGNNFPGIHIDTFNFVKNAVNKYLNENKPDLKKEKLDLRNWLKNEYDQGAPIENLNYNGSEAAEHFDDKIFFASALEGSKENQSMVKQIKRVRIWGDDVIDAIETHWLDFLGNEVPGINSQASKHGGDGGKPYDLILQENEMIIEVKGKYKSDCITNLTLVTNFGQSLSVGNNTGNTEINFFEPEGIGGFYGIYGHKKVLNRLGIYTLSTGKLISSGEKGHDYEPDWERSSSYFGNKNNEPGWDAMPKPSNRRVSGLNIWQKSKENDLIVGFQVFWKDSSNNQSYGAIHGLKSHFGATIVFKDDEYLIGVDGKAVDVLDGIRFRTNKAYYPSKDFIFGRVLNKPFEKQYGYFKFEKKIGQNDYVPIGGFWGKRNTNNNEILGIGVYFDANGETRKWNP